MSTERWQIDSSHSGIQFTVRHLVIAKVRGQFSRWTEALEAPGSDFARGSVDAVIDASSIDTDVADRDAHLRSADFFDVERYPEIRFTSTLVTQTGADHRRDAARSVCITSRCCCPSGLSLAVLLHTWPRRTSRSAWRITS